MLNSDADDMNIAYVAFVAAACGANVKVASNWFAPGAIDVGADGLAVAPKSAMAGGLLMISGSATAKFRSGWLVPTVSAVTLKLFCCATDVSLAFRTAENPQPLSTVVDAQSDT